MNIPFEINLQTVFFDAQYALPQNAKLALASLNLVALFFIFKKGAILEGFNGFRQPNIQKILF